MPTSTQRYVSYPRVVSVLTPSQDRSLRPTTTLFHSAALRRPVCTQARANVPCRLIYPQSAQRLLRAANRSQAHHRSNIRLRRIGRSRGPCHIHCWCHCIPHTITRFCPIKEQDRKHPRRSLHCTSLKAYPPLSNNSFSPPRLCPSWTFCARGKPLVSPPSQRLRPPAFHRCARSAPLPPARRHPRSQSRPWVPPISASRLPQTGLRASPPPTPQAALESL